MQTVLAILAILPKTACKLRAAVFHPMQTVLAILAILPKTACELRGWRA